MKIAEQVDRLRVAAEEGDSEAARELGRLFCLLPIVIDDDGMSLGERWLRSAVAACPDDAEAAVLLAGRLAVHIDGLLSAYLFEDDEEWFEDEIEAKEEIDRKREEAAELYKRVLRANPAHAAARSGLAALQDQLDPADVAVYSYYLVEGEWGSGSVGTRERLIISDADELIWACNSWFSEISASSFGIYDLSVYTSGERLSITNLAALVRDEDDSLNWGAIAIPPLPTNPLPAGHPAQIQGIRVQYGWGSIDT
jgi:hypothetical protein